mmetsp:Transcript_33226/g.38699  ORF Transcript_33226/g.38699 Transcript_33226/m.38699 type:complete len:595 (-) Transcript_33226:278-2062(-)
MKSKRLTSSATFLTSLVCFNLETMASNQSTSLFDIPARSYEEPSPAAEVRNLRVSSAQHNQIDNESNHQKTENPHPPASEEIHKEFKLRAERIKERRANAKQILMEHQPEPGELQRMTPEDIKVVYGNAMKSDPLLEDENNKWMRNLGDNYELADVGAEYDSWAQGYRMLGGFIDCDNHKDGGGSGSGDGGDGACSRWMMWAAYVNPNYAGGGRNEYFGNKYYDAYGYETSSGSKLDCHSSNTEWELLGVYRQEFYQFIEQISKHLWAIDDYEYVVALAGLAYMTDDDCYYVGSNEYGNGVYAGVQPVYGGSFQMGLYSDAQCIVLDGDTAMTFDDFGLTSDLDLGSKDDGSLSDDALYQLYQYWTSAQENTLELLNEVYSEYKYCTLCMDYPTYQDGYFIGDYGTDDDDLINQCWKFHSHDSFVCDASCMALGHYQGTITQIDYLGTTFGESWDGSSSSGADTTFDHVEKGYTSSSAESKFEKFKANAFLTFSGIMFIATFLAFSVARGSRDPIDSSDKKRSLLSKEERRAAKSVSSRRSSKSAKSKSSSNKSSTGKSRSSSRSKSASKSRTRGGSSGRGGSRNTGSRSGTTA